MRAIVPILGLIAGIGASLWPPPGPALADVTVRLKDGREFSLPLREKDIDEIRVDGRLYRPEVGLPPASEFRPEFLEGDRDRVLDDDKVKPRATKRAAPAPDADGGPRVLKVGPGRPLQTPSQAAARARDGDVIEIDATEYFGDVAVWKASNITIRGVGGRPLLDAGGRSAQRKAIWVTDGANITIENIAFANAKVRDRNGAGIRAQGPNLTVRRAVFRDSENGILAVGREDSTIVIEHTEFARNGHGDGRSHGLYINRVKRLVFRYNYAHHARVGHQLKTRARENIIVNNLFMDGDAGNSSYAIDLSNARVAYVVGNVLQQSNATQNSSLIYVGAKVRHPGARVHIASNTVISDRRAGGKFVLNQSPITATIHNNLLIGALQVVDGRATASHNLAGRPDVLVDRAGLDFRLRPGAPAIDAGVDLGRDGDVALVPAGEYRHPAGRRDRPRAGPIDIGAYEFTAR